VCLFGAYTLYGRWLANKWGIDPTAKTPAVVHEDGRDYVPTNGWTVFAHQFSSIAGAGPVTGAIQAAAFGWLPVLLWAASSSALSPTSALCTLPSRTTARAWAC
jgi:carbon starvation protein